MHFKLCLLPCLLLVLSLSSVAGRAVQRDSNIEELRNLLKMLRSFGDNERAAASLIDGPSLQLRFNEESCANATCGVLMPCSASPSSPYYECTCDTDGDAQCEIAPVTPAMVQSAVAFFNDNGWTDVASILQTGTGDINTKVNGYYGLHLASIFGNVDAVKVMLDRGANIDVKDDRRDLTPLLQTIVSSGVDPRIKINVVRVLIDRGANMDYKSNVVNNGWTALQFAIAYNLDDVARVLIDSGANMEIRAKIETIGPNQSTSGMTALHFACHHPWFNLKVVKMLVEKGADVNAKDSSNRTPLSYAKECCFGDIAADIAAYLVAHGGTL